MGIKIRKTVKTYDFAKPNEFNKDYLDIKYSLED